jgi:hypothetical protein
LIPTESQTIGIIPTKMVGDNSFDATLIPTCTLCMELSELYVRFCIVRDENMECIWLEDYKFESLISNADAFDYVKKIISNHVLWSSSAWKHVRITINSNVFSLIPSLIFDAGSAHDYITFAKGKKVEASEMILYHEIPLVNAFNVFTVPAAWHNWLLKHFAASDVDFYHLSSPLIIGSLVSHAEYCEVRMMSIYVEKEYFTLTVTESDRLLYCNRIKYTHADELTYMVLFTLSELGLAPAQVHALCYGDIDLHAEIYVRLSTFLAEIKIGKGPTTLQYSQPCKEIGGHHYFGLFNTYLVSS